MRAAARTRGLGRRVPAPAPGRWPVGGFPSACRRAAARRQLRYAARAGRRCLPALRCGAARPFCGFPAPPVRSPRPWAARLAPAPPESRAPPGGAVARQPPALRVRGRAALAAGFRWAPLPRSALPRPAAGPPSRAKSRPASRASGLVRGGPHAARPLVAFAPRRAPCALAAAEPSGAALRWLPPAPSRPPPLRGRGKRREVSGAAARRGLTNPARGAIILDAGGCH